MSDYERYKALLKDESLPCGLVDLDAVDENMRRLNARVAGGRATIRVASKSVRSRELLRYLLDQGGKQYQGLLCYSVREAAWLAENGFKDLLVAYPTIRDVDTAIAQHEQVSLAVDSEAHVSAIADAAERANVRMRVVIDVDSSLRVGPLHLGVRRSPIHSVQEMLALVDRIEARKSLQLRGLLVYEAHVAGLVDNSPFAGMKNAPMRAFKAVAAPRVAQLREALAEALQKRGYKDFLFNGAGTGTAHVAKNEHCLSEVTIGSGYLASHLFDYYKGLSLRPAALYAVQVTRHAAPGFITVSGGGFTASGGAGADRLPLPYMPAGLEILPDEGVGEVQTGLKVPTSVNLELGDPVFFRHAKAGELAEHLLEYVLVRGDKIVGRAKTYRGEGKAW